MFSYSYIYTANQIKVLTIIPRVTAPISVIASSIIIASIYMRGRQNTVKNRLVGGMCIMDIIGSTTMALSGVYVPNVVNPMGQGNFTTCSVAGFFLTATIGVALYNTALAIFYLLVIVHGWTETRLKKSGIEKYFHAVAILLPISFGAVGLAQNVFNPLQTIPGFCYFSDYPFHCGILEDVPCTRGENFHLLHFAGGLSPLGVALIVAIGCMVKIYLKVRNQAARVERYGEEISRHMSVNRGSEHTPPQKRRMPLPINSRNEQKRQTAIQAFLYSGAYIFTLLPAIMHAAIGPSLPDPFETGDHLNQFNYIFNVIIMVTYPLQGFWNMMAYIRPLYVMIRNRDDTIGRWKAVRFAISGKKVKQRNNRSPYAGITNKGCSSGSVSGLETSKTSLPVPSPALASRSSSTKIKGPEDLKTIIANIEGVSNVPKTSANPGISESKEDLGDMGSVSGADVGDFSDRDDESIISA